MSLVDNPFTHSRRFGAIPLSRFGFLVMLIGLFWSSASQAQDENQDDSSYTLSRPKFVFLVHASHNLQKKKPKEEQVLSLNFQALLPVDTALAQSFAPPLLYAGITWQALSWLITGADLGYDIPDNEPFLDVRLMFMHRHFWSFSTYEASLISGDGFYTAIFAYPFPEVVKLGAEVEGFGNMADPSGWQHRAGPSILLQFGDVVRLDLAAQFGRENARIMTRVHLFFFGK